MSSIFALRDISVKVAEGVRGLYLVHNVVVAIRDEAYETRKVNHSVLVSIKQDTNLTQEPSLLDGL